MENKIAKILKTMAKVQFVLCVIVGFIWGLVLVVSNNLSLASILILIFSALIGFISYIFTYSLGEIIQLLQDIKNK